MRTTGAVLAIALFAPCFGVQSQPPAPSPTVSGQHEKKKPATSHQKPKNQQRGTDSAPIVVKVVPSEITDEAAKEEANERDRQATNQRWLIGANIILTLLTGILAVYTVKLWRSTHRMVEVAENTAKRQLRAYLCVNVHSAHYQLSGTKLHLAARPLLINTGCTPAHKVGCVIKADVFPFPLPKAFLLPSAELILDAVGLLGPQQTFVLGAVVDAGYDSAEIETIKAGHEKRLYVWGTVTYRDIFGDKQHTNFCHSIKWVPLVGGGERIGGSYCSQHSDAS